MTTRLRTSTRRILIAVSLLTVVAAADVVDIAAGATWALAVAVGLGAAGVLVAKLSGVALEVDEEAVVVRNVLATHRIERDEVTAVVPGHWRSTVLLADGTRVPTLLCDRDFVADDPLQQPPDIIDLTSVETPA